MSASLHHGGSFKFTWSRLRAYVRALNVILIILLSPITQETVALQVRSHSLNSGIASIPVTIEYHVNHPPEQTSYMYSAYSGVTSSKMSAYL